MSAHSSTMTDSSMIRVPATEPRSLKWVWAMTAPIWLSPVWLLLVWCLAGTPLGTVARCLMLLLLAVCSYTDTRWGKIRNWATYPGLLWALALNAFDTMTSHGEEGAAATEMFRLGNAPVPLGGIGLVESFAGAVVAFVLMLMVYRVAGGGAGDVKLAAALGAWLGPALVLESLIWTYVVAGVAAVAWVILLRGPGNLLRGVLRRVGSGIAPAWVAPPSDEETRVLQRKVHLAPFFMIGTLAVLTGASQQLVALVDR
jgi:Flp pilus assembly protein protease CpaA